MTTVVSLPWTSCWPESAPPQPAARPRSPAAALAHRRMRLRLMLARDEQLRRRPAVTLPHLENGQLTEKAPPGIAPPAANPPPGRPPPTIDEILATVARHFDVPARSLIGHRGPRPLALTAALALAKEITGATYIQTEKALDAAVGSVGDSISRLRYLRRTEPDLARRLLAIELELGALQEAG